MNEVGERRLAESYMMRRLAQLTIYQWSRLNEWASRKGKIIRQTYIVVAPPTSHTIFFNTLQGLHLHL